MNIVFMSMDTLPSTLWARDLYDQILKPLADRNVLTSAHSSVRECSRFRPSISAPLLTRWKSEESKPFSEISTGIFARPTA